MKLGNIELKERTNRLYKKDKNFNSLIEKADKVFLENFENKTNFERALFFSWYCSIADCKFCYMSAQPKDVKLKLKIARRTKASLIAETMVIKHLNWDFGFFSGGHNAYTSIEFYDLLKSINNVLNEKIWVNIGYISKHDLEKYRPYIKGVVGSIETVNREIHSFACPSKPIKPFEKMFEDAKSLGLKTAMTIILGLGETIDDFEELKKFIKKHSIEKIHFYALNAQKGTYYENAKPIKKEYHAEWVAKTRIEFPKIDIQIGTWTDKTDNIALLLKAGANSISKFPAIRKFATKEAKAIEQEAKKASRKFIGSLSKFKSLDIEKEIKTLKLEKSLEEEVKKRLEKYIRRIQKNIEKAKQTNP